ncbi:MAG TPA: ROK family protein [Polyangia bacterium]|jgi:predicted NBD/HSP70 family sugar kinase|nr:ROK family protein [Polyangia bacterium]
MKLGLDIGGTKIEAAVLDPGGAIRFQRRRATPASYAGMLAVVQHLVEEAEKTIGSSLTVGVGSPGAISPQSGMMQNAENIDGLDGRRLDKDLEAALDRPIRLANDADCFALSEAVDGAAAGGSLVLGVILGTGCGGGLVVERKLLRGANASAGEWGHNSLPWPDASEFPAPLCICGKRGCMELYLSGPGLSRDHLEKTGQRLSPPAIVERAGKRDAACAGTFERYVDRLARAMASLINVLDPDVIVVGGGLSQIEALYTEVPAQWRQYVSGSRTGTKFVPNKHGDSSGVRGAARLWDNAEGG